MMDYEFLEIVSDDGIDIEGNGSLNWLTESRGSHSPSPSKPTCGAFHSHSELAKPASIRRYLCRSKGSRIILRANPSRVVANNYSSVTGRFNLDADLQPEFVAFDSLEIISVRKKALKGVVHEFRHGEPRLVIQVS
jgi:hypothetical protein